MANGGDVAKVKSLANWKCWWRGTSLARDLALSFHSHVDPTKFPNEGRLITLLTPGKVTVGDLQDFHKAKLAEAMLHAYQLQYALHSFKKKYVGGVMLWQPLLNVFKKTVDAPNVFVV